jgi:hypothetical protein
MMDEKYRASLLSRYYLKNGKIYDGGVELSPQQLDASIVRAYNAVRNNTAQFGNSSIDPIAQFANDTLGAELESMLAVRKQLGINTPIAGLLAGKP